MSNIVDDFPVIEGLNSQDWITVADVNSLVEQMIDQNVRYIEASQVFAEEPEILEIVNDGIAEEQLETLTNIRELTPEMDRIGSIVVKQDIETESDNSAALAQQESNEADFIAKEAELEELRVVKQHEAETKEVDILDKVAVLSPKALDKVRELLEQRGVTVSNDDQIKALEDEMFHLLETTEQTTDLIERLEQRRADIAAALSRIASSWELPQALLAEGRSIQVVLDELPVNPRLDKREQDLYAELKEHHVDQPEATLYIALYLKEHANEKVAVDELAGFLYKPEVIANLSDKNLRARVTTLLGPVSGEGLRAILETQGMILQYGWRRTLEANDGRIKTLGRQRIYRAIRIEDLETIDLEGFEENDNYTDEFEIPPNLATLAQAKQQEVVPAIDTDVIDEVATNQTATSETPKRRVDDKPSTREEESQHVKSDARQQARHETEVSDWEKQFRQHVGEAITRLADQGLLASRNGIELGTARALTNSHVFGSPTSIRRMTQAGQLSRLKGVNSQQLGDQVVSPTEMVVMSIFNANISILGGGQSRKRQRRALELISAAVESFFVNQEKSAAER